MGVQGRGDVDEVMARDGGSVLSPELLQHTCAAVERTVLSSSLEDGLTCITDIQRVMLSSSHVCRSCRGWVICDPCQPQEKNISFFYSAVNWFPSRRICPWKAFYLGDTVFLLLLFHVQLILMQDLLIQKHSVLQAKKNYLCSVRFLHQDKL